MSKIVVTGGYGFIGSHFVNYVLKNTKDEITIVDKLTYAANIKNVTGNVKFIRKDICDVDTYELGTFDYLVNFAAESHVDNSIRDGRPFFKSNVEGTFNLIEVARKNPKLKKFVQISTDEVYGDMADSYIINMRAREDDPIAPSSYYSASKASSDLVVLSASRTFNLPYIITRTCNNFGENQHKEKFIPKILDSILNGSVVPVYGDGRQIREWIHADDNVDAIYKIMKSDKINEIYNIGSGQSFENIELIKSLAKIVGKNVEFQHVEDRLGHDRKYALSSMKYEKDFGEIKKTDLLQWVENYLQRKGV